MAFLKPIQERYVEISDQEIIDLMKKNSAKMNEIANKKIAEVYKKVGFTL